MTRENKLLSLVAICTLIMIYWHHTEGEYITKKNIVPQKIMSNIFSSIVGACIVLLYDEQSN